MKTLETYGWDKTRAIDWQQRDLDKYIPARVVSDYGRQYVVAAPQELRTQLAGSLVHKLQSTAMPKIGDWVAIEITGDTAIIQDILPRTNELVRGQVDRMVDKQVVAANIDLAFIVQPLDHDFSPERLERYIFQLTAQRITPIILLNKSDKVFDALDKQAELTRMGMVSHILSATNDSDISVVETYISSGKTIVILGSSGAGKSTLTNRLLHEKIQATTPIREKDSKGRHTTVHRELFVLPTGGMIIDTPGIRELQLWGDETELEQTFSEIFEASQLCRYKNCSHHGEDGCMVAERLENGTIDARRYRIYLNFKHELKALNDRRGFIAERRSQQTREAAKRRRQRLLRSNQNRHFDD